MRVHHVAIQVVDLERARRFWVELLGLPEVRRQDHALWVDAQGTTLMLESCAGHPPSDPWRSQRSGLFLIALAIAPAERERWRARLTEAGHPIEGETAYTLYVRDPDGTRVGLSHHPEPSG
ncbi:MAG: hypothetical protein A2138_11750 [Deltaproteobacteria bacterium RBG_16_71_12]|nr:MAG: hypothetical protein A2138_11750 [Deltaproteobacteria bacterium RBG_16_71_12]